VRATNKQTSAAVVFVNGILGLERLRLLGSTCQYFRGLREGLRDVSVPIYFAVMPTAESVANRATVLASFLANIERRDIYLVAHSMGGLDSRFYIRHLDQDRRVRALATVGTPHRGTPLTRWVKETHGINQWLSQWLMLPGLNDLSTAACERFNEEVLDRPDVRYVSWAGCRPIQEMPFWFKRQTRFLAELEGDNDSQVSVQSASWGEFQGVVRADHLELSGWNFGLPNKAAERPFDHVRFYHVVVNSLLC
jgi:triacylglycerol lipase